MPLLQLQDGVNLKRSLFPRVPIGLTHWFLRSANIADNELQEVFGVLTWTVLVVQITPDPRRSRSSSANIRNSSLHSFALPLLQSPLDHHYVLHHPGNYKQMIPKHVCQTHGHPKTCTSVACMSESWVTLPMVIHMPMASNGGGGCACLTC